VLPNRGFQGANTLVNWPDAHHTSRVAVRKTPEIYPSFGLKGAHL
jgi:hypothetical protein